MSFLFGVVVILVIFFYYRFILTHWFVEEEGGICHFIETEDGWRLELRHYPALLGEGGDSGGEGERLPVILCHDLMENAKLWSLSRRFGWISFLRNLGHDVWVVSLRGRGVSRPSLGGVRYGWGWRMEHHLSFDIPVILDNVERLSGASSFHWVGHNWGAILLSLYWRRHRDSRLHSLTFLLSKGMEHFWPVERFFLLKELPVLPISILLRLSLPFLLLWPSFRHFWGSTKASERFFLPLYLNQVVEEISLPLFEQKRQLEEHRLGRIDGEEIDLDEVLMDLEIPFSVISTFSCWEERCFLKREEGGALDSRLAEKVSLVILKKGEAFSENYEVLDLFTAEEFFRELAPRMRSWLLSEEV